IDVHAPCAAVVLRPLGVPDHQVRPTVTAALTEVARRSRSVRHLHATTGDHGVLLVQVRSVEDASAAYLLAEQARETLLRRNRRHSGCRVIASVGEPQAHLIPAVPSYHQARLSAQVAQFVPTVGDLPRWRDLGVFRVLAQLPADLAAAVLDPRLAAVLRS